MTYEIIFPDGRAVSAGASGAAIKTLKRTASAFPGTELQPGGVCAEELEAEFFDDGLTLTAGDVLSLYEDGQLAGTYIARTPTTPTPGLRRVVAYDFVTKLDTDLTDWLEGLTQWPYSLRDFAQMVAQSCGLTLRGDLANGDWPIPQFTARGITGRQLLQWVCQAGCRFCRAEPDGTLGLSWLTQGPSLTERDVFQGSLSLSDFATDPVDGVRIALTGTPMENHTGELWSIFDFILPGYLGTQASFLRRYGGGEHAEELRERIRPFLMRRLKDEVLKDLPKKHEQSLYAAMTPEQSRVYDSLMQTLRQHVGQALQEGSLPRARMQGIF